MRLKQVLKAFLQREMWQIMFTGKQLPLLARDVWQL
jgi:hypothetical protein